MGPSETATTPVLTFDEGATGRGRRRPRGVVLGIAGLLVAVGAAGGVVLAQDAVVSRDGASMVVVRDAPPDDPGDFDDAALVDGAVTEMTNTYGTEYHVAPSDGRWLDLVVSVTNEGLLPVRLTDVVPALAADEPVRVLEDVRVSVPVDATETAWRAVGEGVVLEPGRSLPIRMTGRLSTACGSPAPPVEAGGWTGTDRLVHLRYDLLGLPRRADPATWFTVALDGPLGCPAP
ncbi:hypothetical protein WDV85_05320 [Pseudokineococcus sp. 5B2Z-1]|uniref:hypothetical protein n=1 Tax=Pseudokineococcus sp. 5B2Z-1 TaxID=3132744 RepID=UPI0030A6ADE1